MSGLTLSDFSSSSPLSTLTDLVLTGLASTPKFLDLSFPRRKLNQFGGPSRPRGVKGLQRASSWVSPHQLLTPPVPSHPSGS